MPVTELPNEYLPFDELEICSNRFIKGIVPIEVHKHAIILVGRGEQPLIWISGLVSKEGKEYQQVVEKNNSLSKAVDVGISAENNSTTVKVGDIIIVQAKKTSEEKAVVSKMDLRPLGLNIYGDAGELCVGESKFIGNIFSNVHTMVGIGQ